MDGMGGYRGEGFLYYKTSKNVKKLENRDKKLSLYKHAFYTIHRTIITQRKEKPNDYDK